jgi:hypothetical protein
MKPESFCKSDVLVGIADEVTNPESFCNCDVFVGTDGIVISATPWFTTETPSTVTSWTPLTTGGGN